MAARGNETHHDGWGYSSQPMVYFKGSIPFQIDLNELLGRRAARIM
jgi:predicted glutamine amidotransferase